MIKIWISYFYQVRKFEPNMIPFSTAMWDPKWFHKFEGQDKVFVDDRGIINGLRLSQLVFPREAWDYLVEIDSACEEYCPLKKKVEYQLKTDVTQTFGCKFMDRYFDHLWNNVNFDDLISYLEKVADKFSELNDIDNPEIVLLVHEAPDNKCGEREVLKKWFDDFGYNLEEWNDCPDVNVRAERKR